VSSGPRPLRSRAWFDNPDNPDMTALYVERYLNYGLSLEELQSNRPSWSADGWPPALT
jgi:dihydroxy-acid dehydratase